MSEPEPIPFNRPAVVGHELDHLRTSLTSGHTSSGGAFTAKVTELLKAETGAPEALLTTSCTSALELSALLLDLQPGEVVIVPSFTFVSSALAYVREGAQVVFCDIEPETLGPDPAHVRALVEQLGERVRAVVVVHYAGIACDMDGLREALADRPDVAVVEDNAHGLFGRWRDQPLGSLGRFATQSFHDTKNFTCGEGGALVLNDADDIRRAWVLYDKGTDRKAFFQGMVDKYSWRDTGSSFGMADSAAAYLYAQLEQAGAVQARRREIWERYRDGLAPVADELSLTLPTVPDHCEPAWHLFHVLVTDHPTRGRVIGELKERGITAPFHYVPLHDSPGGRRYGAMETDCPVTVDVSSRLIRLPFYYDLTLAQQDRVVEELIASLRRS